MLRRVSIVKGQVETETPPLLHGDGVTDDTDAVQWYVDRELDWPAPRVGGSYLVRLREMRWPNDSFAVEIAR